MSKITDAAVTEPNIQKSSTILLTPHQKKIYEFVRDFVQAHHYSPSFREIQSHFSFSSLSSVHKHLQSLQKKGVLTYNKGARRSIALTSEESPAQDLSDEVILLPIIAELIMGQPLHLFSSIQAKIPLLRKLLTHPQEAHVLQVTGSHLLDFHICNQDFIVIEARKERHEKDLLLVKDKQGKYYVKRFVEEKEGSGYSDPLFITEEELKYGSFTAIATLIFVMRNGMFS